jgi:hypothetical protein
LPFRPGRVLPRMIAIFKSDTGDPFGLGASVIG